MAFILHPLTQSDFIGTRKQQASFIDGYVQSYFISANCTSHLFCTVWTKEALLVDLGFRLIFNAVFTLVTINQHSAI